MAEILQKNPCFFFEDLKTPKGHFKINLFLRLAIADKFPAHPAHLDVWSAVSSNSSIIDLFLIIGTCYMFVAEKKTYLEAKAYCEGQVAKVEGAHFCCLEIKKTYVINSGVCLFVPKF